MSLECGKHGGHRERLRERFINDGLDGFEEHTILELLLFYAIPQKNTNELAHVLLNALGSLEGILEADPDELMRVEGVGEHTAQFFSVISLMAENYITDSRQDRTVSGMESITEFAVRKLALSLSERLIILFIDSKFDLISWHCLCDGCVTPDEVDLKALVRMLMGTNTTYVMIARSNAKGLARLNKEDKTIALAVSEALRPMGVSLYDYIAVGHNRACVTMYGNACTISPKGRKTAKAGGSK